MVFTVPCELWGRCQKDVLPLISPFVQGHLGILPLIVPDLQGEIITQARKGVGQAQGVIQAKVDQKDVANAGQVPEAEIPTR